MRHPERVEDYLGHIAQAIERARSYVQLLPDLGGPNRAIAARNPSAMSPCSDRPPAPQHDRGPRDRQCRSAGITALRYTFELP
jgi:hypothetical protein